MTSSSLTPISYPLYNHSSKEGDTVTLYKFLNSDMTSYGDAHWQLREKKEVSGDMRLPLCTGAWLHGYEDAYIAAFMGKQHFSITPTTRLFKGIGVFGKADYDWKIGYKEITLLEEMYIPVLSVEQRVSIGILCAKEVYFNTNWIVWTNNWLSGKDRSYTTAAAAADADAAAADAADADAADADADAADAAADAAAADADAADADAAADAAARYAARYAAKSIDLKSIIEKVLAE